MGFALVRIAGKPHVHRQYGRWLLRRPPAAPIVADSVPKLSNRLSLFVRSEAALAC
jgi:hypothetical protein